MEGHPQALCRGRGISLYCVCALDIAKVVDPFLYIVLAGAGSTEG